MDALRRQGWATGIVATAAIVIAMIVLVGRASPREAAAATTSTPDTVTVVGVGTADGAPDTLSVDFTVHVTRFTVQAALDAQAADTRRLFRALQNAGVQRSHLMTTDLSLDRHYDEHGNVSGYDASETVRARITPLAHAGRTISTAAGAANNDVEVGSLSFDISHDSSLLTEARHNAFTDAKARAQEYASLASRSLGRVVSISERINTPTPPTYYGDALLHRAVAAPSALPFRKGQQTITVHVTVVWALS